MREPKSAAEALVYQVECTMATFERLRDTKRTPKAELRRHLSIIQKGLDACLSFSSPSEAEAMKCLRVARALREIDSLDVAIGFET